MKDNIKSTAKWNSKKNSVEIHTMIPDISSDISISTQHHMELTIVRHDVLNIILKIFYDMAKLGEHIERIEHNYSESVDISSVSFLFSKFHETFVVSWGPTVSVITLQSFVERERVPVGNIAIMIHLEKPPTIENLNEDKSTLTDIIFKHLYRNLSQYNPKNILK